jgi:membrane protein
MARAARERREPFWVTALKAGLLVTKFWRRPQHRPNKPPKDKVERGWREILKIFYDHVSEHRLTAIAGGVTYFALLAMFPFVGAIVAIYGLFGDAGALGGHLDQLSSILPGGAIEVVGDQLKRAAQDGTGTLGLAFLISIAISLWSANAGVKALFDALNIVYDSKETRGFMMLNAVSLVFTIAVAVFILQRSLSSSSFQIFSGISGLGSQQNGLSA